MRWLDRLERRLHWLAFPGLFRYLALIGGVAYLCQAINPQIGRALAFDRDKILDGEWWRVLSFAFTPMGMMPLSGMTAVFLFFGILIAFLVSDSLEQVWGATRTTLYILTGWIGLAVGQFLLGGESMGGSYLYASAFFAFATYFPRYEFRLFFILPVQVRFLAWLSFGLMVLSVIVAPLTILLVLPTLIPYALWVLPQHARQQATLAAAAQRRRKFNASKQPESEAFHRCATCHRTERDDPSLEFRTFPDGTEFCLEHLPESPPDSAT